jgi:hypothetical protein
MVAAEISYKRAEKTVRTSSIKKDISCENSKQIERHSFEIDERFPTGPHPPRPPHLVIAK